MKLFHVSFDITKEKLLTPRIPSTSRETENQSIPRVCFSENIEGCINSIFGLLEVPDLLSEIESITVYEIDTDDLAEGEFVSNYDIIKNGFVEDAEITKEWWILKDLLLCGKSYDIQGYDESARVFINRNDKITYNDDILDIIDDYKLSGNYDTIIENINAQEGCIGLFGEFRELGLGYYLIKNLRLEEVI